MQPQAGLLRTPLEWFWFVGIWLLMTLVSLSWEYYGYRQLKAMPQVRLEGVGVAEKVTVNRFGHPTRLGKIEADGLVLWARLSSHLPDISGKRVEVLLATKNFDFVDYMTRIWAGEANIRLLGSRDDTYTLLREWIASQHQDALMRNLFLGIYLDEPLSPLMQQLSNNFGLAAMLTLSGLNLALLSALLYPLIYYPYRFLQERFFPWRHRRIDVLAITLIVLGGYVALTGFPPSLTRAYAMAWAAWLFYTKGVRLLSFETLTLVTMVLIALSPRFALSLGFWLSVIGVFYIFLYLRWYGEGNKIWVYVGLNFWIFVAMAPVIHFWFDHLTFGQLSSPITSMLFDLIYPLSILLHLVGLGGVADDWIKDLLLSPVAPMKLSTPLWFLVLYAILSLLAIKERGAFMAITLLALLFVVMGYWYGEYTT